MSQGALSSLNLRKVSANAIICGLFVSTPGADASYLLLELGRHPTRRLEIFDRHQELGAIARDFIQPLDKDRLTLGYLRRSKRISTACPLSTCSLTLHPGLIFSLIKRTCCSGQSIGMGPVATTFFTGLSVASMRMITRRRYVRIDQLEHRVGHGVLAVARDSPVGFCGVAALAGSTARLSASSKPESAALPSISLSEATTVSSTSSSAAGTDRTQTTIANRADQNSRPRMRTPRQTSMATAGAEMLLPSVKKWPPESLLLNIASMDKLARSVKDWRLALLT